MATIKSDLLDIKNQANEKSGLNENYSISIEEVKSKMGRGRGRPPKNSCSSSGSTCSENSIKDVIFFLSIFRNFNGFGLMPYLIELHFLNRLIRKYKTY